MDIAELHENCLTTLLSLLEGVTTSYIPRMMLITLDFKVMVRKTTLLLSHDFIFFFSFF